MGIIRLFKNYQKQPSYKNRCSELAHKLVDGKTSGVIIEIIPEDLSYIFFADGNIERYDNMNKPVDDNDLVTRNDEINYCYSEIYDDVIKKIKDILSPKGLRLTEDNEYLKIKRK